MALHVPLIWGHRFTWISLSVCQQQLSLFIWYAGVHQRIVGYAVCKCVCRVLNDIPEKLKFTPTPQPAQCLELDKEITIQCSAKGREAPTIRWTKAGVI